MKDIMLADTPIEQREQILRDSCDQIVERSYTRRFDQQEINERRASRQMYQFRLRIWNRNLLKSGLTTNGVSNHCKKGSLNYVMSLRLAVTGLRETVSNSCLKMRVWLDSIAQRDICLKHVL